MYFFGFSMRCKWIVFPFTFHPYTIPTAERSPPLIVHVYMYTACVCTHTSARPVKLVSDTEVPVAGKVSD